MKNWTILLFSGSLSKICCTKLDLLQGIRKFYGALFDVHGFLKYERRHQSVAFNSLAMQWVGVQNRKQGFTYNRLFHGTLQLSILTVRVLIHKESEEGANHTQ